MNNKTINFNCGQLIQLIGKTINFSEPLVMWKNKMLGNLICDRAMKGPNEMELFTNNFGLSF